MSLSTQLANNATDLFQLVKSTCGKETVTSLLTTYNRLVVSKLSQTMRAHPHIGLLIPSLLPDVNRFVITCAFLDECVLSGTPEREKGQGGADFVEGHRQNFNYV